MTRILLVVPPSQEQLAAPLVGLQYVAASLLDYGCEVRVIDGAARFSGYDEDRIVAEARLWAPDMIGLGLYTRGLRHGYALAARLRGCARLLVAGGPHATACPEEVLAHGFDVAVTGEGERTMLRLVDHVEARVQLGSIQGVLFRAGDSIRSGRPREFIEGLDSLPFPDRAQALFDPRWYDESGRQHPPGGVLSGRGCPARCTFCANYVTGRRCRFRSPANIAAELNELNARYGVTCFQFWDDSLTANPARLREVLRVLARAVRFPLVWTASTRVNLVTPSLLREMKAGGCTAVNFGIESGAETVLRRIGKGISAEGAERALEWAKTAGLTTSCNFILGFPDETPAELTRTYEFIERVAPLVDWFSTLGVLVPFPGTAVYTLNHHRYGFTNWWLRQEYTNVAAFTGDPLDADEYADDPTLDVDFFRYDDETRALIRACLRLKAAHNLRRMGLPEPAAV